MIAISPLAPFRRGEIRKNEEQTMLSAESAETLR